MSSRSPKRVAARARGARQAKEEETEPPPLDVEALLQAERARLAHEQLAASQAALRELAVEHTELYNLRLKEEKEGRQVAELFRAEMTAKGGELAAAQAELAAAAAALEAMRAAAAEREAALHAAFDAERQSLLVAAAELQARLDGLSSWQEEKQAVETQLVRLQQEKVRAEEQAAEKIRSLQRRLYELGHGGAKDAEGTWSEATLGKGEASAGGEESTGSDLCLQADLHRLLAHNRKVAEEMQQYGQEAEELQREMRVLESERAALLRDAELAEEMEAQYAKRGTLQAREIRDQRSKITSLEKGLARMAADFEAEKTALEASLRAQLADAAAEQNALRRLLQVRTKELRQVRRLAQEVLLQRSDVEAFLVSSIQQVREEMAAEAVAAAAAGGMAVAPGSAALAAPTAAAAPAAAEAQAVLATQGSSTSNAGSEACGSSVSGTASTAGTAASSGPCSNSHSSVSEAGEPAAARDEGPAAVEGAGKGTAGAGAGTGAGLSSGAGQMDIKQLGWQDRERILRLLFAKINRAAKQPVAPAVVRAQPAPEAQPEAPLGLPVPQLRGVATEAGRACLA